jgi:hypothetical protein
VRALLGEVAAVHDQHARLRLAQRLGDKLLVLGQHRVVIPGPEADELLHRLHVAADQRVGHRLDRLALQRQQLPLQVLQRPATLLRPLEQRGELAMVGLQLVVQRRHVLRRQLDQRRPGRGRGRQSGGAQRDLHRRPPSTPG